MAVGKQIKIGAILSYVHIIVGAIITFLFTPFMIRIMGKGDYGLYNTVASVISSLSILSLGFGSSYVRFYIKYKEKDDEIMVHRLNGMFLIIFLIIGIVAFICGFFLSQNLELVFSNGLTQTELEIAEKLMLLLAFNLAVSFPSSVFSSIITANERFIFQKILLLVKQVASPLISIPILLSGYGSYGIVLTTVVVNMFVDIVNMWFAIIKLNTRFLFDHFDKAVFKSIAVFSSFIAINMIVDQINLNIDKILLGRFCGTSSVAVYSAGFLLYHYVQTFSTSISNVFTPRTHKIWNSPTLSYTEKNRRLSETFGKVGRIQLLILLLICSGLVLFGQQFILLWIGEGYQNSYYVVLLLALSALVPLTQNVGIEIQRAKNKHKFRSILYAIMALINLFLSIILCQLYAEVGSAIGTAISFIVANTILMNIYYSKELNIDISIYWKNFGRCVLGATPAIIIGGVYCQIVDTYKLRTMIIGIILYSFIYLCSQFLIGTTKLEKLDLIHTVIKP